jgi:uncharacterized protein (TIGR02284 family)
MNSTLESPAQKEVLSILQNLIETARDGEEGFQLAAKHTESAELKAVFTRLGTARSVAVAELQQLEHQHGKVEADHSGSVTGGLHRAWINLRTVVASRNDQAILEEAERGEDAAVEAWRSALHPEGAPLPRSVTTVLEPQLSRILASHHEVRAARDSGRFNQKDSSLS